ncbi:MAG: sulfonate transport system permease protein [Acidimicrobiaceae bacterium]|nr:sulfonate transport system permease protein [Acidimicrobiaceae bacterium]
MHSLATEARVDEVTTVPAAAAPPTPAGLVHPATVAAPDGNRRWGLALRVLGPLGALGIWWLLTGTGIVQPTALASPLVTAKAFWHLLTTQNLLGDIGVSLARAGGGLAIGAGLGFLLGIFVGLFRLGEELLDSSLQMFRTIPFPAVIFIFIIWFGIGEEAKVLLIALATMFPMYLNTANGVRNVDRKVVEAARTFGLRGRHLVGQVVVPLALPSILTGLRYSTGISVIALVFAESVNANLGIGALANQAASFNQVPVLMVCILVYAVLGIGADLIVRLIERLAMPWRRQVSVR